MNRWIHEQVKAPFHTLRGIAATAWFNSGITGSLWWLMFILCEQTWAWSSSFTLQFSWTVWQLQHVFDICHDPAIIACSHRRAGEKILYRVQVEEKKSIEVSMGTNPGVAECAAESYINPD